MKSSLQILSVNVSRIREVPYKDGVATTGIFKEPAAGPVMVRRLNIDGDDQADRRVHGGYDMAVYAYPREHYPYWEKELGRDPFPYGQFGENLTVVGLAEDEVRVGDVFAAGGVRLQVTQPRIPCYKLGIRMEAGDEFPGRFQKTGRMGWYFRVLTEGEIAAGTELKRVETDEKSVTIAEFIRIYLYDTHDPEALESLLGSRDLGEAWRKYLEEALERTRPVATAAGWQGYRCFTVAEKVRESASITSFHLKPKDGKELPEFLPGQFLTLRLQPEADAKPVTRTYSISSSPNRRDLYRITVKRVGAPPELPDVAPGLGSGYLHDHVDAGDELNLRAPGGKFFLDPRSDSPIVLLSAGVGLTPLVSMLAAVAESKSDRPVWFVHGARNAEDHALREEVENLAQGGPNIHVHFAYSRAETGDACDSRGRVTVELLKEILPQAAYDFYLCGPKPFMRELFDGLEDWGVPPTRIFYEFFGKAENLGGQEAAADDGVERHVSFAQSRLALAWEPEFANLLDFAEAQGLRPAFSCRNGICHTCMVPLVSGEVDYVCDPIDLPDPGSVLICCAKPKSDVVIDV